MRFHVLFTTFILLMPGLAAAEEAGPVFGSSAMGTFVVVDQFEKTSQKTKIVVQAAGECSVPNCDNLLKTAHLPASGKKP